MRRNDVLGVIFSNTHDELVRDLTGGRTMGSVPFGGRYRLIDFSLSNLVNAGIAQVGIITRANYQSLMDHLGSGKPWDLARKSGGLYILPPYGSENARLYNGRIEALAGISGFLEHATEEYVVMCDADVVCNIDMADVVNAHIANAADITIAYKRGALPRGDDDIMMFDIAGDGRIRDMQVCPDVVGEYPFSLDIFVMSRTYLIKIISEARARNLTNFAREIIGRRLEDDRVFGYEVKGFTAIVDSMHAYQSANMALLNPEVMEELFPPDRPVYTKIRDEAPAKYGLTAHVNNSLIADGCKIEGSVENCIFFRAVKVGKGARLENCVIMQDTEIGENANLVHVITDKNVVIKPGRTLMGFETYPVFIGKGMSV